MAKRLEFKPKTRTPTDTLIERTPTDTLIDRLIQAFAGQTVKAELYRYDLSTPVDVNAGDSVSVTWTIGITLGTNCKAVENVLEVIEGISTISLQLNGMTFVSEGSAIKTYDPSNATVNVAPDITNDKVTVSVTFTDPDGFSYDEITLINVNGAAIISLSATGTVSANVQTTVEVTVSVKK